MASSTLIATREAWAGQQEIDKRARALIDSGTAYTTAYQQAFREQAEALRNQSDPPHASSPLRRSQAFRARGKD